MGAMGPGTYNPAPPPGGMGANGGPQVQLALSQAGLVPQSQLSAQLPNMQVQPTQVNPLSFLNNWLMQQGSQGAPQGQPQSGGGLNNMMSFMGNLFGPGGMASGVGDAASSIGSSIGALFGL